MEHFLRLCNGIIYHFELRTVLVISLLKHFLNDLIIMKKKKEGGGKMQMIGECNKRLLRLKGLTGLVDNNMWYICVSRKAM